MPTPRINKENKNKIHFLTFTTIEWIDIFTKQEYFDLIINTFKHCQKNQGLLLYGFVIMTNHIHCLVSAKENYSSEDIVASFKKFTTSQIKELLEKDNRKYLSALIKSSFAKKKNNFFQIWQRENYPEIIESEKFFLQKLNYIHNNPVKKGYVIKPEDWLYSSARNYLLNDNSVIVVDRIV
ncbi:transposase [Candidatus Parcubacteria bacterium]|nr:transposase [Candidatus Parcubacteria bacterium]